MKVLNTILLAGALLAPSAEAADLPTRKDAPAPARPNCFETFWTFMNTSPADCPLAYAGVTLYGQIDAGAGYETNASKLNKWAPQGVSELIGATNHGARWQLVPNGFGQSNLGVKWREEFTPDGFFIGDVNFGFDPYTLRFADGPRSLLDNNLTPAWDRSTNADSSRTYGPINTRAFAGLSSKTYGTLTYGRQYAFTNDNINFYDPMGGAYAFSLIGYSSTLGGGDGVTELARFNNSLRYLYANHDVRAGVLTQVGGWSAGNNAQYALQANLGFDYQNFSIDGVYVYARDAVNLGVLGAAAFPDTLRATLQNVEGGQIGAKYKWERFQVMGGWQIASLTNPSDLPAGVVTRDFNGGVQAQYGTGVQGANNYPEARILQTAWIGGRYAATPTVDLALGYYHTWQNRYDPAANCAPATPDAQGHPRVGTVSAKCAGAENAVSGLIDWKATRRLDVYAGAMYSTAGGGLASNFYASDNLAVTAGARFSF